MNNKVKYLLLMTVISLPLTLFLYMPSNMNDAPQAFSLILQMNDDFSMNDYFAMKYSLQPHPQRLMNMSLTVAESGALSLRVSPEAADSLDFDLLMRRSLTHQMITHNQSGAISSTSVREATMLVNEDRNSHYNNNAFSTKVSDYDPDNFTNGTSRKIKHILYWGKCSRVSNFNFGAGEEAFIKHHCAVSACSATEDPHMVPENQVDAILFCLGPNLGNILDIPPFLPRFSNAKRVVVGRECPAILRKPLKMYRRMFDYTITYRYDSDSRTGYGKVVEVNEKDQQDLFRKIEEITSQKSKMAAWFVSQCRQPSKRDKLTQAIQKHGVDVDIYGACGQLKCQKIPGNSDCFKMLEKDYKFYLSFENSLCNHYVSEKFTNILRYNIVPVTYGLGHELLGVPKDAYIDVFDYPDVASLAKHLLYLASNDSAYNEYFRWKKHLRVTGYSGEEHPFCKLCADLHADPPLPQRKYDLQAWFSDGQCIDVTKNPRLQNFLGIANGQTCLSDEIGLIKLLALFSMYHLLTNALNIGAKLCETMIP